VIRKFPLVAAEWRYKPPLANIALDGPEQQFGIFTVFVDSISRPDDIMSSLYFRALLVTASLFTFVIPPLVAFVSAP
jgi:hypothetical protein